MLWYPSPHPTLPLQKKNTEKEAFTTVSTQKHECSYMQTNANIVKIIVPISLKWLFQPDQSVFIDCLLSIYYVPDTELGRLLKTDTAPAL